MYSSLRYAGLRERDLPHASCYGMIIVMEMQNNSHFKLLYLKEPTDLTF